ncbi:aminotransferase class I/II-fold pyridoxal phosphate-dependent enzyme [Nocardioides sp. BGMRC 2183]|nr:aminotransferase class I/II-fold pyridoxal phosphate-dependent enzyme [Nocardioides sp. BGMRC 2183]
MSDNPLEVLDLAQLQTRSSWKWRTYPQDVLPLWVAEMDVPLAPPVVDAIRRAAENGDIGYPTGTQLEEAFTRFAARRWNWTSLEPGQSVVVPDVMNGFAEILQVVTSPGDAVIVNPPVYTPFYSYTTHHGRSILEAPLGQDHRISLDNLEQAFRTARAHSDRAAYLLCNPHNPTGVVHTLQELTAIVALARRHGVTVISDEIHAPLVYSEAQFTPLLTVPGAEGFFALNSASKAWNLAGAKAALLTAGPEAVDQLAQVPSWVARCASHLGVLAQTAAFDEGDEWLDALLRGLEANRALLGDLVAEHLPAVGYLKPEGTYMAWLDCRQVPAAAMPSTTTATSFSDLIGPAKLFHDEAKVAVSSGHVFGSGGAGRIRLNFATSTSILTEALTRMGRALR